MIAIDNPYNCTYRPDTTTGFNPKMITNTNYPTSGDDAIFLNWRNRKNFTGKNDFSWITRKW